MSPAGAPGAATVPGQTLRVVLDTNVVVALFIFRDGSLAAIDRALERRSWTALTEPRCIDEFRRVLAYPMFGLDAAAQALRLAAYAKLAHGVAPVAGAAAPLPLCRDRDDQKFLELARDGGAAMLVTADKDLLKLARRGRLQHLFRIVTPTLAAQLAGDDSAIVVP